MTKAKAPSTLRIYDQFGEPYDIDPKNKLWAQALAENEKGAERIQFPLSQITDALEWGWWTCFKTQREWVESCGIPVPDHKLLFGLADADDSRLRTLLQTFGGYVSYLEGQLGIMEGRRHALKQGYEGAILVASASSDGAKKTEKAKEAEAIAKSETLRQMKRMQIEQETILATAKGMLDGYKAAYDTTSRVVSTRQMEAELTTRRHA